MFSDLSRINIHNVPVDPVNVALQNKWLVVSFSVFSHIIKISAKRIAINLGFNAFSFWSDYHQSYVIAYNDLIDVKDTMFGVAHEIGHIYFGHVSKTKTLGNILKEGLNNSNQEEILANNFAKYILDHEHIIPESERIAHKIMEIIKELTIENRDKLLKDAEKYLKMQQKKDI